MAGRGRIRRNFSREQAGLSRNKSALKVSGGVVKRGDARLKIIQKNRLKLVDARDKLAQMAKRTDARDKILKLRELRQGEQARIRTGAERVRSVGNSILLKTDRNGKISLSTNKITKRRPSPGLASASIPADINTAIRKELGLITSPHRKMSSPNTISGRGPIRQVHNSNLVVPSYMKTPNINDVTAMHKDIDMGRAYMRSPPLIKRTIHNDLPRELPPLPEFSHRMIEPSLYTWFRSGNRHPMSLNSPLDHKQSVKVTARNNLATEPNWNYADPNIRSIKMSNNYIDLVGDDTFDDEDLVIRKNIGYSKTNVHSRLDTPAQSMASQGIFAQKPTPKVVVPVGHRIVVSNLQATVTKDDIRELFEDVGELLVSRLVRAGTAEVIYKNLKDAQKAVDTYHNRQLDGQPMKCLLVNKRPLNNPTAPALRPSNTTSVLRTSGGASGVTTAGIVKKSVAGSKNIGKLVPDISTIHKVLFHKS